MVQGGTPETRPKRSGLGEVAGRWCSRRGRRRRTLRRSVGLLQSEIEVRKKPEWVVRSQSFGPVVTVKPETVSGGTPDRTRATPQFVVGTGNEWSTVIVGKGVNTVGLYRVCTGLQGTTSFSGPNSCRRDPDTLLRTPDARVTNGPRTERGPDDPYTPVPSSPRIVIVPLSRR